MEDENEKNLFDVTRRSSVSVPILLYHDMNANVIVMTDLGSLPSISTFFTGTIGGHFVHVDLAVQLERSSLFSLGTISSEIELEPYFIQLGRQFGTCFALIHSPNTLNIIGSRFRNYSEFPSDTSLNDFGQRWDELSFKARLELFPSILTEFSVTAQQLYNQAKADSIRNITKEERAFIHGDAHPNAMLVAPPLRKSNLPLYAAFIDWEFAKIGRGVSSDFAIASAFYAAMEIAAAHRSETMACTTSKAALQYIRKFRYTLVSQYRTTSLQEGALWAKGGAISDPSDPRAFIIRSTMIVHGSEIIRRTATMRWACGHTKCMKGSELEKSKGNCELLQRMARYGAWYLCSARSGVLEFSRPENWKRLQTGHREEFWLFDLFL